MTWDLIDGEYIIYQSEINSMKGALRCPQCSSHTDDEGAIIDVEEIGKLITGTCLRCGSILTIIVDDKRVEDL